MTAEHRRSKADELELMARSVSFRPDRARLTEQARYWRLEESKAHAAEARRQAV